MTEKNCQASEFLPVVSCLSPERHQGSVMVPLVYGLVRHCPAMLFAHLNIFPPAACLNIWQPKCISACLTDCLPATWISAFLTNICFPKYLYAHLSIFPPACLNNNLPSRSLLAPQHLCLPDGISACLPEYLPACQHLCLPASISACPPASLHARQRLCLPASIAACLTEYLPASLTSISLANHIPGSIYRKNLSLIWTVFVKRGKACNWMNARD